MALNSDQLGTQIRDQLILDKVIPNPTLIKGDIRRQNYRVIDDHIEDYWQSVAKALVSHLDNNLEVTVDIGDVDDFEVKAQPHTGTPNSLNGDDVREQIAELLDDVNAVQTEVDQLESGAIDLTQYLLLAGRAGGQTAHGGTASGDDLTLRGTANAANDGDIILNDLGGQVLVPAGSEALPGLAFIGDPDTGIFSLESGEMAFVSNAAERWTYEATGVQWTSDAHVKLVDNRQLRFGNAPDSYLIWGTAQLSDTMVWSLGTTSKSVVISHSNAGVTDFNHGAQTYPTIFLHSDSKVALTEYLSLAHEGVEAVLATGAGSIALKPNDGVGWLAADAGGTAHFSVVGGASGVAIADLSANLGLFELRAKTAENTIATDKTNRVIAITTNPTKLHDHAAQTNPTLFIHSDTDPDTDNTQWIGLHHDQTDGVIDAGKGGIRIPVEVGIGVSPSRALDIVAPVADQIRLRSVTTDATLKEATLAVGHYTNAEADFGILGCGATSTQNIARYGGGFPSMNAATHHRFYTAATNTTVTGTQRLEIDSAGAVKVGGGTPNFANAAGDLYVTADLEVDGFVNLQGDVTMYSSVNYLDDVQLQLGSGPDAHLDWSTAQVTANTLVWGFGASNSLLLTTAANRNKDHDHAAQTNPTLFIHSATDPDTNNTQWLSLTHDGTHGVISTGVNNIELASSSGTVQVQGGSNSPWLQWREGINIRAQGFYDIAAHEFHIETLAESAPIVLLANNGQVRVESPVSTNPYLAFDEVASERANIRYDITAHELILESVESGSAISLDPQNGEVRVEAGSVHATIDYFDGATLLTSFFYSKTANRLNIQALESDSSIALQDGVGTEVLLQYGGIHNNSYTTSRRRRRGTMQANGTSTLVTGGAFSFSDAQSGSGSKAAIQLAGGMHIEYTTGAVSTNLWRVFTSVFTKREWGPCVYHARITTGASATTDIRMTLGWNGANTITADNPAVSQAYFRYSEQAGGDSAWMACVRNGTAGTQSAVSTGVSVTANTVYDFEIRMFSAASGNVVQFYINGVLEREATGNLPVNADAMYPIAVVETRAGAARRMSVNAINVESY